MVISCSALGCKNRRGCKPNISFHRIPTEADRRQKWLAAINRTDWQPSQHSRICSDHFVHGRKIDHPFSIDYVPSVFVTSFVETRERKRKRRQLSRRSRAVCTVPQRPLLKDPAHVAPTCESDVTWQKDLSAEHIQLLERQCEIHQSGTFTLKERLRSGVLEQKGFENKDKLETLTGLQNYQLLMVIFDLVNPALQDTLYMTCFQQLLITLMRLRVNLPLSFFSYLFDVHSSTISRIFTNVINVLNEILVPMCVLWPKREHVQTSMPLCFRKSFKHCLSVINCFEISVDKPKDLKEIAQTHCQYEPYYSLKYLISLTPQGVSSFVSKGWGGRTPDDLIIANCGFLDHLVHGDLIFADRSLTVQNQVGLHCVKVEMPAFRGDKKQLVPVQLEGSHQLAAVRTHVKGVIGQAHSKFKILHEPVPFSLLAKDAEYTTLDKIVRVTCALTNLCPSVMPFN